MAFRVHVPASTPTGEPVYVTIMLFHDWDWREHVELTLASPGIFQGTVQLEFDLLSALSVT